VLQAVASEVTAVFNAITYVFSDPQFVHGFMVAIMLGLVTGGLSAKVFGLDLFQAVRKFINSLFMGIRDMAERLVA